ncbi:MAG: indole-3-glycerol phosphate synthase TrpC [Phycisphaerae bacterium]
MNILQRIVITKKREVAAAKVRVPLTELQLRCQQAPRPRNFFSAMTSPPTDLVHVIAEVKKASPSAGVIRDDFDPIGIAKAYCAVGADALSVLTDQKYFHGSLAYLRAIRQAVTVPILRKDFIIDRYQVWESRAAGADAILLIAEILDDVEMPDLLNLAAELRLTALIEVHEKSQLLRIHKLLGSPLGGNSLLGINNRDLTTFKVNVENSIHLAEFVENKTVLVAESGIHNRSDILRLRAAGIRSVLIGETLMRSEDIGGTMANLKGALPAN